ncbi:AAA family ATPase [Asanoa sp. WMMD1127]|uniref:AAA family ATPase n=1 Tax=Asanoa sp. WMMD1127 TaxID=3016107 RepID=UPI002417FB72|nr:AAA family ATPase [Asanoa sp. WMMD1127]MDG4825487.1 AAA family ATPase [Asanoa sp. WMMD1127]
MTKGALLVVISPAVLVAGPPASGKTVLGAALAGRLRAALLDLDVLTNPLTAVVGDLVGTHDVDDPRLVAATRRARYDTVYAAAVDNLAAGIPVVLVAPFTTERRDPGAWRAAADRLTAAGGRPSLVWLRADRALLADRMSSRAADRDRPKLADLTAFLDRIDLAPPAVDHLAVDAAAAPGAQLRTVLDQLDASRDPRE